MRQSYGNLEEAVALEAAFATFWGDHMYGWLTLTNQPFEHRGQPYRKAFVRRLAHQAAVSELRERGERWPSRMVVGREAA